MTTPVQLTFKSRLLLALFGSLCGLVCVGLLAIGLQRSTKGRTEFESFDDLRRAMLRVDEAPSSSTPLNAIIQPHPQNDIIFSLRPHLNVTFQGKPLRTNSCGMRGAPFSPQDNTSSVRRIAFLGDSFTIGWGVAEHESFPEVTVRLLNERSNNRRSFQALNYGTPGYSTFQEVARFLADGIDLEPAAIVVYFIENDFGLPFYMRDLQAPGTLMSLHAFTFLPWAEKRVQFQEHKTELGFVDPNRALHILSLEARKRGIPVYLALNPGPRWRSHRKRLPILAQKRPGIITIPLPQLFEEYVTAMNITPSSLSLSNDPHPSPIKHEIVGHILAASLFEYLPLENLNGE